MKQRVRAAESYKGMITSWSQDCITSPNTDENSTILLLRKVHNVGRFYKNPMTVKVAELEEKHPGIYHSFITASFSCIITTSQLILDWIHAVPEYIYTDAYVAPCADLRGCPRISAQLIGVILRAAFCTDEISGHGGSDSFQILGEFGPLAPYMTGKRSYNSLQVTGDAEDSAWTCGVACAFITHVPTCKEFIETLVATAEDSIRGSAKLITPSKL